MLCVPKESNKTVVFVRVDGWDKILQLEKLAKKTLGRNLGALEYLDQLSFDLCIDKIEGITNPFKSKPKIDNSHYLLIELSSNAGLEELSMKFFEKIDKEIEYDDCVIG